MGQGFFVHTRQSDSLLGMCCFLSELIVFLSVPFVCHPTYLRKLFKVIAFGCQTQSLWMANSMLLDAKLIAFAIPSSCLLKRMSHYRCPIQ